jgi:KaiC/GvpD/RAD55 family RecA-like ATPase
VNNVASTQFEIGLAATKVVMRTLPVSLKAQGYTNGENVSVDVQNGGLSVPGFPTSVIATTTQGIASYLWTPSPSTPLGTDTIRFRGSSTFKSPSDTQRITVVPSNITISGFTLIPAFVQRTQSFEIRFSAFYASGGPLQSGSAAVRILEADGMTNHFVIAGYNSSLGIFRGTYRVGLSAAQGTWTVNIDRNSADDGYGNIGPNAQFTLQLGVQPAILSVSVSPLSQYYDVGNGIGIFASITNPDGSTFNSGTVTITLSSNGTRVGNSIGLAYVPARGYWTGLYTVGQNDPSGQWVVLVDASDPYGNRGQVSILTNVKAATATSQAPPLLSLPLFLFLIGAATVGSFAGIAYLSKNWAGSNGGLPFDTLFQLTGGEIPEKSIVLILAERDDDATALGLQLANRYLAKGHYCGLLAYGSSPADLAGKAKKYGWKPGPFIEKGSLEVLDCFNREGIEGIVKNPLDFSEVGVSVGAMLEKAVGIGPAVIVIDSLTNTFKKSTPRKVMGFLSFLAEKVKGEKGILFLAIEKNAVPLDTLTTLEGLADGIIELGGEGGNRTLEVQKTFGRHVKPPPVEYYVKAGRGLEFRRIVSSVSKRSKQGVLAFGLTSKRGVSYMSTKSMHGAASARAMSMRTLTSMRTQSKKRVSPFAVALRHTLLATLRPKVSKILGRRLSAPVRRKVMRALKHGVSRIFDALPKSD